MLVIWVRLFDDCGTAGPKQYRDGSYVKHWNGNEHTCSTRLDNGMISCWGSSGDDWRNFQVALCTYCCGRR